MSQVWNSMGRRMKVSSFTASNDGVDVGIDRETVIMTSNAKFSVTGDVRNRGEMRLEDTDVKIDGNFENEGVFSMNEKMAILAIINAMNVDKPDVETINKSLSELHIETKGQSKWRSAIDYIKTKVKWEFSVSLVGGIPQVEFKIGSN